jgi:hypothetical protein
MRKAQVAKSSPTAARAAVDRRGPWTSWMALAAIVAGSALLRIRLLGVPLERDEGEYAYMGQLILRGEVPYLAAHNMKLPGVYYANALVLALLGETDVAVRLGLLVLNAATIVLLYLLARRLVDTTAALTAAAAYGVTRLFGNGAVGPMTITVILAIACLFVWRANRASKVEPAETVAPQPVFEAEAVHA